MASALENYVNNVRTLSASGNYRDLADQLSDSLELLTKNWSILDNVLETLDIQQHTLGVLYVLIAKFNSAVPAQLDTTQIVRLMHDFVLYFDVEQMRLTIPDLYELCHLFTNFLINQPNCILGIKVLAQAINKIRQLETQLTPIHADLCQLSLKTKCFNVALRYLDIDITDISTVAAEYRGQNNVDPNHDAKYFLLYYYYGGMIYTAVKNYERALYFYEVCISTPAMAMSHIMLEAYKKFILVSLIVEGKIANIPKNASQVVSRYMKPMSQHYHDLAISYAYAISDDLRINMLKFSEVFTRDNNMGLVKQVNMLKFSEVFTRDNNMGLVKQVVHSLHKRNIQRLTKTFLTLSLSDVASRVQLPNAAEAEKYILNMIKSGEIFATINQKDGMVIFKDDPEKYNTPEMFLKVQEDMSSVMDLVKQINKMEEDIILNPIYVKKSIGNQDDDLATQHPKTFPGRFPQSDPTD